MAAVCVIKEVKPDRIPDPSTGRKTLDYWGPSKRILGDMNFLQTLKDFDKDDIRPEVMAKIRKDYLPHRDFRADVVAKASSAAEGLCKWIIAMDMYDRVAKEVAPKKVKLEKAEAEYAATVEVLNEKKGQVARIEQRLADLNAKLKEAKRQQSDLEGKVENCTRKLDKALTLIDGLSDEKHRWNDTINQLREQTTSLPGNMLLASAIVTYLSSCDKTKRSSMLELWHSHLVSQGLLPTNQQYNFTKTFAKHFDFHEWHMNGLPQDDYFLENAIISKLTGRWSLFVDPQKHANKWIRKMGKSCDIRIVSYYSSTRRHTITECFKNNQPILLENVPEKIDLWLKQILFTKHQIRNEKTYITIDNVDNLIGTKFTFNLTTQSKEAAFNSDIRNKITIINFVLSQEAIYKDFLAYVTVIEKPILKKLKFDYDIEKDKCNKLLTEIENGILRILYESTSDILEDESGLRALENLKQSLKKTKIRTAGNSKTERELKEYNTLYEQFSRHAAILYLTIYSLVKINPMYQFSYNWYTEVLIDSTQKARKSRNIDERIRNLIASLTLEVFNRITTSIFAKDRLLFLFMIALNLLLDKGKITLEQINFLNTTFCHHTTTIDGPDWLPHSTWDKIISFCDFEGYEEYSEHIRKYANEYKKIYESKYPVKEVFPDEQFHSNFDKLVTVFLLRPDDFHNTVEWFVGTELGFEFIKYQYSPLSVSYNESNIQSPLLFLLKSDSDTLHSLLSLIKTKRMQNRFKLISIGEPLDHMEKTLDQSRKDGFWVCIQNVQLTLENLNALDLYLDGIDYDNTHEDFRLWLTSGETVDFPVSLLEKSIKIAQDTPKTIKNSLLQFYSEEPVGDETFFTTCPGNVEILSGLTYNFAYLHSWLRERSNFGWNVDYEFRKADFRFTLENITTMLNDNESYNASWISFIGECIYGNIVCDPIDKEILLRALQSVSLIGRKFTFDPKYQPPNKIDHIDFFRCIHNLPDYDEPSVFDLADSYHGSMMRRESNVFLKDFAALRGLNIEIHSKDMNFD